VGNVDETLCRSLFDQMDLDKDVMVSREEFIAVRQGHQVPGDADRGAGRSCSVINNTSCVINNTSVSDKTTEVLTELSVDELRKEVAVVLPRLLKEHGDEVNRKREQTKKKLAALQSEKGEGKFANLPTAAYGNKEDFHKGLEVLGQPTASPEHAGGADNGVPEAQRFT
jgi:hypothetical protein